MSSQLLQIYTSSAQIIHNFLLSRGSIKNLCYASHVQHKKQVYALVIQTLKYKNVLLMLIAMAQIPGCTQADILRWYHALAMGNATDTSDDDGAHIVRDIKRQREAWLEKQTTRGNKVNDIVEVEDDIDEDNKKKTQKKLSKKKNNDDSDHDSDLEHDESDNDNDNDDSDDDETTEKLPKIPTAKQEKKRLQREIELQQQMNNITDDNSISSDDNNTTGITVNWYPAVIKYSPRTTNILPSLSSTVKNTNNNKRPNTTTQQQPQEQYTYPIESLLVVVYDYLFNKQGILPKLTELVHKNALKEDEQLRAVGKISRHNDLSLLNKRDAERKTFEQGILDVIRVLNIPNPHHIITYDLLSSSYKSLLVLYINDTRNKINNSTNNNLDNSINVKALQDHLNILESIHISKNEYKTGISLPISSISLLSTIITPQFIPSDKKERKNISNITSIIKNDTTYKQRLLVTLPVLLYRVYNTLLSKEPSSQLYKLASNNKIVNALISNTIPPYKYTTISQLPPLLTSYSVSSYDFLLPTLLHDKYKRTIPRYARINTNKVSSSEIFTYLSEMGYTQLSIIPASFRFPHPTPFDTTSDYTPDSKDQYDTRIPCIDDPKHIITRALSSGIKYGTTLWDSNDINANKILSSCYNKKHSDFNTYKNTIENMKSPVFIKPSEKAPQQPQNDDNDEDDEGNNNNDEIEDNEGKPQKQRRRNFWIDQLLPDIICFSPDDNEIVHSELVKNGLLIIQDRSSCLPPVALLPPLGATVLDGCSAPGNKTGYLSALMQNTGKIYAIELNETRSKLMRERLDNAGCTNIDVINTSFFDINPNDPKYSNIEYILLDPSCSGSGNIDSSLDVLLTNDGQFHHENSSHVVSLSLLQTNLLKHAFKFPKLKALSYSTCSVYDAENECVVREILTQVAQEKGFELIPALPLFPARGRTPHQVSSDVSIDNDIPYHYTVRVDPKEYHAGGFFLALFARPGVYNDKLLSNMIDKTIERYPNILSTQVPNEPAASKNEISNKKDTKDNKSKTDTSKSSKKRKIK